MNYLGNTWQNLLRIFPVLRNGVAATEEVIESDTALIQDVARQLVELDILEATCTLIWQEMDNALRRHIVPKFWTDLRVENESTWGPKRSRQCHPSKLELEMHKKFSTAIRYLYDNFRQLAMQMNSLNMINKFSTRTSNLHAEDDLLTTLREILLSQIKSYFCQIVWGYCSVSLKVFVHLHGNAKKDDMDSSSKNADTICKGCSAKSSDQCQCLQLEDDSRKVNKMLLEMGLLDRLTGQTVTNLVQQHISDHIKRTCNGVFDRSHVEKLESWLHQVVLSWLIYTFHKNEQMAVDGVESEHDELIESFKVKLTYYLCETYSTSLIDQFFNIIIDFPDSIPAIDDLKRCMEKIDLRKKLIQSLRNSLEARILHPGVNTMDILTGYVATIKALRYLDGTGMILEAVTLPIRDYLRKRTDTVRRVVTGLTEEGPTDLSEELARGEACKENINTEAGGGGAGEDLSSWEQWQPDPFGIAQFNKGTTTQINRSADIISMVVDIYGTKELFMNEYRNLMADRLLSHLDFNPEKEIRNLELLKLRFGENLLHSCEVMLKDVTDSKRINSHIQNDTIYKDDKSFDISALIISAEFWPSFNKENLELPEEIANELKKFTKSYEAYKGNRTLSWRTVTGRVNIVLEHGGRTIEMTVAPTQAVIIYHFQHKDEWSLDDLSSLIKVPPSVLRRRIAFWQSHGLLSEVRPGIFKLVDEGTDRKDVNEDIIKEYITDDEDLESAMATASDQREEELQVFWSYIVGMLTNLDSLPLERIHQMLKLFASDGIGIEFTQDNLKDFLQRKVREHKLVFSGGVYQLTK